jgi:nucleoside-diphosphate-sugar epimerase
MGNKRSDSSSEEASAATLITGGSGFIGSNLSSFLSEKGKTVVSLYHHRLPEALENVFPVCSDMNSPELLAAPLRGVETVYHLAWEGGIVGPNDHVSWDPSTISTLPRNVQITRNLVTAMERTGTKRIVFLSAIGASRHTREPFLMEKYLAEFFILNSKIPEKIILRTSVVWGGKNEADKFIKSIQRVMKLPVYPVPRKAEGLSPIHIDDLVNLMSRLSRQDLEKACSILEVNGGDVSKIEDIFKIVCDKCVSGSKIGIPGVIGESILPLFERDSAKDLKLPKLKHFLALGTSPSRVSQNNNPLLKILAKDRKSFRERLVEKSDSGGAQQ